MARLADVNPARIRRQRPLDAAALATRFKQGRKIAPKVAAVLAALARMGFIDTADGGQTFVLRRAA